MKLGPVFREGIQIYLVEGHGLVAPFYLLILLAPVVFLTLFLPSLDAQIWIGPANLFKVSSVAALMLIVYFGLRVANQEFASWKFLPLRRWLQQEGVSLSDMALDHLGLVGFYVFFFVFLSTPLLIWAGAIARAPLGSILATFLFLLFYALTYSVWGLVALALWERSSESRQVFVRGVYLCVFLLSAIVYIPLNPVAFLLSYLGGKEMAPLSLWGWQWPAPAVHFLFHLFLLGAALLIYRWALRREAYP
jgi:hypothetical protein